jgi:hypothetical protein
MEPKIIVVRYRKACDCPNAKGRPNSNPVQPEPVQEMVPAMNLPNDGEAPGKEYSVTFTYDPFMVCDKCERPWEAELQRTA